MDRFKLLPKSKLNELPKTSGVYSFYGLTPKPYPLNPIYIGKAINIQNRVKNHFYQPSYRDNLFIDKVDSFGYLKTDSEIGALILEASLIKKYQPKFNVVWRDDKNYFYVAIAQNSDRIPYVYITHQPKAYRAPTSIQFIGPFVEGTALKMTLRFLRRAFPYYTSAKHSKLKCTWCHLGLCPGLNPDLREYKNNIKKLILILKGKSKTVLNYLKREMTAFSKKSKFEEAGKIRDTISNLQQVMSHANIIRNSKLKIENLKLKIGNSLLSRRVECYDISNIQGKFATGSMVVFTDGKPDKNEYRKFKIRTGDTPNDIAMLKEVLERRFAHKDWKYPEVILIDGGKAQLNIAIKVKKERTHLNSRPRLQMQEIKVISIAKGKQELFIEGRKEPISLKNLPQEFYNLIKNLDDEAHRFAISYHKKLRKKELLK